MTASPHDWNSLNLRVLVPPTINLEHWRSFWEGPVLTAMRELHVQFGPLPTVPPLTGDCACPIMDRILPVRLKQDELWIDQSVYLKVSEQRCTLVCRDAIPPQDVLALAFTEVHRAGGWLPLHASVVSRGGQAVAVTGPSGAGKSTALLQLLELGFEVIAEDRAFWHAATGQVAGLDRHLRVYQDSVERFVPTWLSWLSTLERDAKGKFMLPLPPRTTGYLRQLLLLGEQRPLSAVARVRVAWELTGVPLTTTGRQAVQTELPRLLPLIHPSTVSREHIIEQVRNALDTSG